MPPGQLRQIIAELEAQHHEGYVQVACHLLDMSGDARKKFVKYFDRAREGSRRDGREHSVAMLFPEADFGLCVWSGARISLPVLAQHMESYCAVKKYETKSSNWVGLATHADLRGLVHAWNLRTDPWEHDAKMEEAVSKLPRGGKTRT